MTADTITIDRIDDIIATLEAAVGCADRMRRDVASGEFSPAEAAAILNETLETIQSAFR